MQSFAIIQFNAIHFSVVCYDKRIACSWHWVVCNAHPLPLYPNRNMYASNCHCRSKQTNYQNRMENRTLDTHGAATLKHTLVRLTRSHRNPAPAYKHARIIPLFHLFSYSNVTASSVCVYVRRVSFWGFDFSFFLRPKPWISRSFFYFSSLLWVCVCVWVAIRGRIMLSTRRRWEHSTSTAW